MEVQTPPPVEPTMLTRPKRRPRGTDLRLFDGRSKAETLVRMAARRRGDRIAALFAAIAHSRSKRPHSHPPGSRKKANAGSAD